MNKTIIKNIKRRMFEKEINQKELSKKLGYSSAHISKLLKSSFINEKKLKKLADALDTTAEELVAGICEKNDTAK